MVDQTPQYKSEKQKQQVTETNYDPIAFRYFSDYPFAKEICALTKAREHSTFKPLPTLVSYFEAREKAIDRIVIERGINRGVKNFIEFAGGYSTRPLWMTIKYPEINFVDTDQTSLVHDEKRGHIRTLVGDEPKNLHYIVFDVVEGKGLDGLMALLPSGEPRFGMYAGLLRYKNHGQKVNIARVTSNVLGSGGVCVTCDVRTKENIENPMTAVNPEVKSLLTAQSKQFGIDFAANEFENNSQFIELFKNSGYSQVELIDMGDLVPTLSCLDNSELFPLGSEAEKEKVREFYKRRKLAVMTV